TDGTRPIRWFARAGVGTQSVFSVPAMDSTGAGDAFVGGLLQGLAEREIGADALAAFTADEERRDEWLRFAAACGALAVTRAGSFAAMPTAEAVHAFLKDQP